MKPSSIIAAAALAALAACSSTSGPPPATVDVQAARACQTFVQLGQKTATGDQLIEAVKPLLAGAAEAETAGQPAPKWSDLGGSMLSMAAAYAESDAAKITAEGDKVLAGCASIPAAAKRAGGFTK